MWESLSVFVGHPLLALVPALFFASMAVVTKSRFAWSGVSVWVLYGLYELAIQSRILCSGECDIRVDLIFIFPLLIIVSLIALAGAAVQIIRRRSR